MLSWTTVPYPTRKYKTVATGSDGIIFIVLRAATPKLAPFLPPQQGPCSFQVENYLRR